MMAYGCLIILRAIFMGSLPFSGRLGVEAIREEFAQMPQQLTCFYFSSVDHFGVVKDAVQDV